MKISKKTVSLFLSVVFLAISANTGFAGSGCGKDCKSRKSMDEKFFHKIKKIYIYQEQLGIKDDQMKEIKTIKMGLKRALIKKDAEIDLAKIDVKEAMMADPLDLETVNILIDKKYELKKEKAKMLASACESMRKILTAKQKEALKEMMIAEYAEKSGCSRHN